MKDSDFLLSVISARGGIKGRTLLQKTCYFVLILQSRMQEADFRAHFYGPYSPKLDGVLNQLVSLGLVQQRQVGFGGADASGFEIRRNDFELTEAGDEIVALIKSRNPAEWDMITGAVRRIKAAGDPNYVELSVAAKVYFIVNSRAEKLTKHSIIRYSQSLGWNIEHESTDKAVSFLEKLDLVENT